jgi:hypothetical protein
MRRRAQLLLPLPIHLVFLRLIHLANLRIIAALPRSLSSRSWASAAAAVKEKALDSNETASALEMLVIDLLLSDR